MKKLKITPFAIAIALMVLLTGCGKTEKMKVFDVGCGLSLTLPEDTKQEKIDIHYDSYINDGVLVVIDRYTFERFEAAGREVQKMSVEDYNALIEASLLDNEGFIENESGDLYMTYINLVAGKEYFFYCTTRKGSDSFWLVTFACEAEERDKFLPEFDKWNAGIIAE